MDKYEYKVRSEEISKLIDKEKYAEAVKIADTIDWRRVKSATMLLKIAALYRVSRRNEDSREILMLAYERYPTNRAVVYSLCELSIELDDVVAAIECYKQFVKLAPKDNGVYTLRYRILEAQEASLEERIEILEELKKKDYQEEWAYELAYLYHRVGLSTKCVEECDDIILWFGDGAYVMKAMELKAKHVPLTDAQQQNYDIMRGNASQNYSSGNYDTENYDGEGYDGQNYDPDYSGGGYDEQSYNAESYDGQNYDPNYNGEGYDGQNYYAEDYGDQSYGTQGSSADNYDGQGYGADNYDAQGYAAESYNGQDYRDNSFCNENDSNGFYADEQYSDGVYGNDYGQADYSNGQYTDGGYGQENDPGQQYAEDGYAQNNYVDDGYGNLSYVDGGYQDNGYTGEFYVEQIYDENGNLINPDMYPDSDYAQDNYTYPQNDQSQDSGYAMQTNKIKEYRNGLHLVENPAAPAANSGDMSQYNTINLQKVVAESMKELFPDDNEDVFAEDREKYNSGEAVRDSLGDTRIFSGVNDHTAGTQTTGRVNIAQMVTGVSEAAPEPHTGAIKKVLVPGDGARSIKSDSNMEDLRDTTERSVDDEHARMESHNENVYHEKSLMDTDEEEKTAKTPTGPMKLDDVLVEWERMKQDNARKNQEQIKKRVLTQTGRIFTDFDNSIKSGILGELEREEAEAEKKNRISPVRTRKDGFLDADITGDIPLQSGSDDDFDVSYGTGQKQSVKVQETMEADTDYAEKKDADDVNEFTGGAHPEGKDAYPGESPAEDTDTCTEQVFGKTADQYAGSTYMEGSDDYSGKPSAEDISAYAEEIPAEDTDVYTEEALAEGTDVHTEELPAEDADVYTEEAPAEDTDVYTEEAPAEGTGACTEEICVQDAGVYSEEAYTEGSGQYAGETDADDAEMHTKGTAAGEYVENVYADEYNGNVGEDTDPVDAENSGGYTERIDLENYDTYADDGYVKSSGKHIEQLFDEENDMTYMEGNEYPQEDTSAYADEFYGEDIYDDLEDAYSDIPDDAQYTKHRRQNDQYNERDLDPEDAESIAEMAKEDALKTQEIKMNTADLSSLSEKIVATTKKEASGAKREEIRDFTPEEQTLFENFAVTKKIKKQIIYALENMTIAAYTGNVIITGDAGLDTMRMAKNLIKEYQASDESFSGKLAKITGEKINQRNIKDIFEKLNNGGIIIEKANGMSEEKLYELAINLNQDTLGIVVIMEDTKKEITKLLEKQAMIVDYFNIRIDLMEMDNNALVAYAKNYALALEYSIDELGTLALYTRIANMQSGNHVVTKDEVRDIIDEAIWKSKKSKIKNFVDVLFARRYDDEDMIVLKERDFM